MDDLINKYVEVRVEKQLNAFTVKFLGFIQYEDFVKTVEYEYELIKHYQLKKCIIDLRKIPVYASGMPEYVKDVWFPTVSKLGLKYIAFVVPAATVGKMSMKKAHENTETIAGMNVVHLNEFDDAINWLKDQ